MTWPGIGVTYADGAYATTELIAGSDSRGRWRGVRLRDGAAVIIAARFMRFSQDVVDRFGYQGPGVAPLVFVGPPDGYVRPLDAGHRWELLATIEQEPSGRTLDSLAGELALEDMLRIGWGMAEMVAAASAGKRVISGLRPEVAYATAGDRGWRFTGLCPMSSW